MRVAFVINSLGAGGTERSTAVLLPLLRDRGVDPVVLCLVHREEGDEAKVRAEGFDVRVATASSWPGRVREVRRLLADVRPDVVHTAIFDADVVGRIAAVGTGVPVVSSLVNTPYVPERLRDPNVSAGKVAAVRAIDMVTGRLLTTQFHAVTEGVATDAASTLHLPPARITVVERGRDPEALGRRTPARRARVRATLGWDEGTQVLLAVGRQEHQKAHVHLVEALRLLRAEGRPVVLAIAGRRGNATATIDEAVTAAGLDAHVHRLDHRDDVPDLLVAADVFVMPSLYEGTAGAAIEALSLETPVVATDLVGTRGILVEGVDARLVPVGDPQTLAATVADVLDDPEAAARRATRGRALFEERFTLDRSADGMVRLYDDVARRGRRRRPR